MNEFIIVQCPYCKELLVFYSYYKTKLCTRCGKRFKVKESKKLGVFKNHIEAIRRVKELKLKYGRRNY